MQKAACGVWTCQKVWRRKKNNNTQTLHLIIWQEDQHITTQHLRFVVDKKHFCRKKRFILCFVAPLYLWVASFQLSHKPEVLPQKPRPYERTSNRMWICQCWHSWAGWGNIGGTSVKILSQASLKTEEGSNTAASHHWRATEILGPHRILRNLLCSSIHFSNLFFSWHLTLNTEDSTD